MIYVVSITDGKIDTLITGTLSDPRADLVATTITDFATGKQYAVFAGGSNSNGASNIIDAFCITNGAISN